MIDSGSRVKFDERRVSAISATLARHSSAVEFRRNSASRAEFKIRKRTLRILRRGMSTRSRERTFGNSNSARFAYFAAQAAADSVKSREYVDSRDWN